ncbi:TPA: hypothetical protein N0F65_005964 [Lagenidium giganteum]|uniref:Rhodanese domain-containing protein n=1 Tax=Lagenidium giganteum TaxID=4803 RepID=A0AAV2ZC35_9STRA|nr:TPA: hypothetical protein N0F65_005964 [Lagenidium giganteum]
MHLNEVAEPSVVLLHALAQEARDLVQKIFDEYAGAFEWRLSWKDDAAVVMGVADKRSRLEVACLLWLCHQDVLADSVHVLGYCEGENELESHQLSQLMSNEFLAAARGIVQLVSKANFLEALEDHDIVDCRTSEMFHGLASSGIYSGHLSGAVNLPFEDMVENEGDLVSSFELTELVERCGVSKSSDSSIVVLSSNVFEAAVTATVVAGVTQRQVKCCAFAFNDEVIHELPNKFASSLYAEAEITCADDTGAFDLSEPSTVSDDHAEASESLLTEFDEAIQAHALEVKNQHKKTNEAVSVVWTSPSGDQFFNMPEPLSKPEFLAASKAIFRLVSFVLAPLGFPDAIRERFSLSEVKTQCSSLFQDVIEVCSDVVYGRLGLCEGSMAMSVHKWVEDEKDSECSEQVRAINELLENIYTPPTFVEVPDLSDDDVFNTSQCLQKSLASTIESQTPWALNKNDNSGTTDHPNRSSQQGISECMYSSVVVALGFTPEFPPVVHTKLSTLQEKSMIKAVAEAVSDEVENKKLDIVQLQALMDASVSKQEQIKELRETAQQFYVMNHVVTRPSEEDQEDEVRVAEQVRRAVDDGDRQFRSGRYTKALEAYSTGFFIVPLFHKECEKLFVGRAMCHVRLGNTDRAKHEAELGLRLNSFSSAAYQCLGEVAEMSQQPEEAMQHFVTAFVVDGSRSPEIAERIDRASRLVGRDAAKPIFDAAIKRHEMPATWLVESYFESFELDEERSVRVPPSIENELDQPNADIDGESLFLRAVHLKRTKRYAHAFEALGELVERQDELAESNRAIALNLYASFLYVVGDVQAAVTKIDGALAVNCDSANSWVKRGGFLSELGELKDAAECFEHAMELEPNSADVYLHKGQMELLEGNYQDAVQSLRRAITRSESLPVVHVSYGMALYKSGSIYQALDVFKAASASFPESAEVHLFHGEVLSDQGNYSEAMSHFLRAYELSPQCPLPFLNAGRVFIATNDPMRAIMHFKQALAIDPRCSSAHLDIAQVLFAQGRTEEAFEHFDTAAKHCRFLPEIEEVCSCRAMAKMQLNATRILGVDLRHIMRRK